jgi:excisionase family DNA binding protein
LNEKALSIPNSARDLDVSDRTVRRLIANGDLKAYRIGRQWRVFREDLKDFLARHSSSKQVQTQTITEKSFVPDLVAYRRDYRAMLKEALETKDPEVRILALKVAALQPNNVLGAAR